MSLLRRIDTQQNDGNDDNSQNNNPPQRPLPGRGRLNANQQQNSGGSPFGSRRSPFGRSSSNNQSSNESLTNIITTSQRTMVRFSLEGMGDPFYRLLGDKMNPEFANARKLAAALEKGGERVDALTTLLNETWEAYNLTGAALVFNYEPDVIKALRNPTPMPKSDDDEDDFDEDSTTTDGGCVCLRAIDMPLTLNVLARSRSQVLLTGAPLVFGVQYLTRTVVTDDPRLVELAQASGAIPDPA